MDIGIGTAVMMMRLGTIASAGKKDIGVNKRITLLS